MSSSLEYTFEHSMPLLFLCSYVLKTSKHPLNTTSANDPSSLARTRDLIKMTMQMPARALYSADEYIPGPSQEWQLSIISNVIPPYVLLQQKKVEDKASQMPSLNEIRYVKLAWTDIRAFNASFVLMFFCLKYEYTPTKHNKCPRQRHPWLGPGILY